jgi:hypothetical protein
VIARGISAGRPPRKKPPSLDTRRIKLKLGIWTVLESEARRLNTTPSRLAGLIIETVLSDDLLDAVLDGLPRSLRNPASEKRERKLGNHAGVSQF